MLFTLPWYSSPFFTTFWETMFGSPFSIRIYIELQIQVWYGDKLINAVGVYAFNIHLIRISVLQGGMNFWLPNTGEGFSRHTKTWPWGVSLSMASWVTWNSIGASRGFWAPEKPGISIGVITLIWVEASKPAEKNRNNNRNNNIKKPASNNINPHETTATVGGFKHFLCSSKFGEDEPILTIFFNWVETTN